MSKMIGTLFLRNDGHWIISTPTASGFQHTSIGRINGLPTRKAAKARAIELQNRSAA